MFNTYLYFKSTLLPLAKNTTMFQERRKLDKASLGFGFLSRLACTNVHAEVESSAASVIAKMTNNWPKNKAGTI